MNKNVIMNLKVKNNEIKDMAGNIIDKSTTVLEDGKFSRKGIKTNTGILTVQDTKTDGECDGDFTFSTWIKMFPGSPYPRLFGGNAATYGICLYLNHTANPGISFTFNRDRTVQGMYKLSNAVIPTDKKYHHLAIVRKDGTIKTFIDGKQTGTLSENEPMIFFCKSSYILHRDSDPDMVIDDFCIIKDEAKWFNDFTPPTTYLFPDKRLIIDKNNSVWEAKA